MNDRVTVNTGSNSTVTSSPEQWVIMLAICSLTAPACVWRAAGGCGSLPVKQVLSANRAANTAACPSSGARILARAPTIDGGHGDRRKEAQEEEEEAAAEGSRCCSFPHPPVLREERTPKSEINDDNSQENQESSGGEAGSSSDHPDPPVSLPQGVCAPPLTCNMDAHRWLADYGLLCWAGAQARMSVTSTRCASCVVPSGAAKDQRPPRLKIPHRCIVKSNSSTKDRCRPGPECLPPCSKLYYASFAFHLGYNLEELCSNHRVWH